MRSLSDCISDMLRTRTEDREIEYLLSRQSRDDTDGLVSLLATLNLERLNIIVDDRAADFAAAASRVVRQAQPVASIRPARSRLVHRLATAALTAVLLMGLTGVAQAADASAPGDTLYSLDRALEQIGINDGGLDERLDEAQALADDGQSAEALAHLAEALENSSPNAADALERAAEGFGQDDNPSQAVRERVADMLEWMATREVSGREFGQGVAQRARQIGAGHEGTPPATLPDNASQNQENADSQGRQDNQDEPDDSATGSSGGRGNSGDDNSGRGGGSGSDHGPPGGSPPGKSGK
jgi:hypothetical protein